MLQGLTKHLIAWVTRLTVPMATVLLLWSPARSQSMPVPIDIQFPLLLKVFSADRSLTERSGTGEFVIGVIYQTSVRESARAAEAIKEWVEGNPGTPVAGLLVRIRLLAIDDMAGLGLRLSRDSVDLCYITPLRAANLDSLLSITRLAGVATCTGVPEYVERGVSVGVGVKADHPQILVNLIGARAEKIELSSRVLKLARIFAKD